MMSAEKIRQSPHRFCKGYCSIPLCGCVYYMNVYEDVCADNNHWKIFRAISEACGRAPSPDGLRVDGYNSVLTHGRYRICNAGQDVPFVRCLDTIQITSEIEPIGFRLVHSLPRPRLDEKAKRAQRCEQLVKGRAVSLIAAVQLRKRRTIADSTNHRPFIWTLNNANEKRLAGYANLVISSYSVARHQPPRPELYTR